jgi:hypothetical protein
VSVSANPGINSILLSEFKLHTPVPFSTLYSLISCCSLILPVFLMELKSITKKLKTIFYSLMYGTWYIQDPDWCQMLINIRYKPFNNVEQISNMANTVKVMDSGIQISESGY